MQFPVPQFTDVEDKLIGSLTFKQFGILFGAGVMVFLPYSLTKSIPVLIVFAILIGLPAIGLAFAKINGRPMYRFLTQFISFVSSPKVLVFHKESSSLSAGAQMKNVELSKPETQTADQTVTDPKARLKELNRLLEQKAREEKELIKQQMN